MLFDKDSTEQSYDWHTCGGKQRGSKFLLPVPFNSSSCPLFAGSYLFAFFKLKNILHCCVFFLFLPLSASLGIPSLFLHSFTFPIFFSPGFLHAPVPSTNLPLLNSQSNLNLKCWFLWWEETWTTWRETLRTRTTTSDKLNWLKTTPGWGGRDTLPYLRYMGMCHCGCLVPRRVLADFGSSMRLSTRVQNAKPSHVPQHKLLISLLFPPRPLPQMKRSKCHKYNYYISLNKHLGAHLKFQPKGWVLIQRRALNQGWWRRGGGLINFSFNKM